MLRKPMRRLIVVFLTVVAMLAAGVNIVPEAFGETADDAASSETVQSPVSPEPTDGIPSTSNSSNSNDVSQDGQEVTGNSKSEIRVNLFKDANHQQPLENTDKVQVGDTIYGHIVWDWDESEKPTIGDNIRYYTFPKNITVKDVGSAKNPKNLYDARGDLAGGWWITDGVVYGKWNEDWLKANPTDVESFVNFDFTLNDDGSNSGDKVVIDFGTKGEDITVNIDKSKIEGSKTYTINADGTVTFTVNVKPKFDVRNMVVTDTLGTNFNFVKGSFKLDGKSLDNVTINGQNATVNLGDLKANAKNGYKLTYTATLTDEAKKLLAEGKLSQNDSKNTAEWSWTGSETPGKAETTPYLNYQMVDKSSGSLDGDKGIKWIVNLNNGNYKADMGGYTFTDTLKDGHHYTGTYQVYKGNDWSNPVASGTLDGTAKSFTYTFPNDAGHEQYHIVYYTALDDPSSQGTVSNSATITPPGNDPTKPGGSDDGTYTPPDTNTYITKTLDSNTAASNGLATWSSVIATSKMSGFTDPKKITFTDKLSEPSGTKATFTFYGEPTLALADGTKLVKDTDYTLKFNSASDTMTITFKGDKVGSAIGQQDIKVTYTTVCDRTPGTYDNKASVKFNGVTKSAEADYTIDDDNLVSKTGSMKWDKDFDWSKVDPSDKTKGAWIATWKVTVNEDNDPYNGAGKVDLKGQPIIVTDTLPQGMRYIPAGAGYDGKYTVQAGWWPGALQNQSLDAVKSESDGRITFTIPTKAVVQNADGSDKAYAVLTYSTAAKGTGEGVNFTNSVDAQSGSTHLGTDSSTVKGKNTVIDKAAQQIKDLNHVRYTISVNPESADLIKDSDTITLSDVMDAKGTFMPSSLKVTNVGTGETVVVPVTLEDVTDEDGNPTQKLTITLPDSTALKVVYDVKPTGKPGDKVTLSNTASLKGVAGGSSTNEKKWTITNASAGTEGASGTVTVTKVDADDLSRYLQGAEFALYQVDMDKLSGTKVTFEQVKNASSKVQTETTNANGMLTFGSADNPLANNTLYYFMETKAPNGYELDSAPHYFMIPSGNTSDAEAALARAKGFGLAVSSNTSFTATDVRIPSPATASVTLGKQLSGRAWADDDQFTFRLSPDAADSKDVTEDEVKAAMPKSTTAIVRKTGTGADGSSTAFSFGDFTFSKTGTYAYTVKETGNGGNGLTLDTRTAKVVFTVTKNAVGDLVATSKITGLDDVRGTQTFKNTYTPTSAKVSNNIKVQKDLYGTWKSGYSFEFRLEPSSDTPDAPLATKADERQGYTSLTVTDGEVHVFPDITYTKAGVYHYNIYEHTPPDAERIPGIGYSNALFKATVTVVDDGKGNLSIEPGEAKGVKVYRIIQDNGDSWTNPDKPVGFNKAWFQNVFDAESINLSLLAIKNYTDKTGSKPLTDGMFSFTLTGNDKAPMPNGVKPGGSVTATVTSDGAVSFPSIKYTTFDDGDKTYTYTLKENAPAGAVTSDDGKTATLNGMTYDLTVYTIKVELSNEVIDGQATLVSKTTTLDAQGNPIEASKLDQGRSVFSNTYDLTPATASVAGQKTLTGRDMDANERFTFQLAAAADDTAEAKAARDGLADDSIVFGDDKASETMTATVTGAQDRVASDFTFDGIHFTKPGVFKFRISETGDVKAGTTKDTHVSYATVTVKDNGTGGLVTDIAYDNTDATTESDRKVSDKTAFTNTYGASGRVFFLLHKKLTAASGAIAPTLKAGMFTFGLYQGDGAENKTPIQTKSNIVPDGGEAFGHIVFDGIIYTPEVLSQAVAGGYATYDATAKNWTLTYTVAELNGSGQPVTQGYSKDGIVYDATTRKVIVTVRDMGNGTLDVGYRVSDGDVSTDDDPDSEEAAFNNVYTPSPATAQLYAQKTLSGRDWQDGDSFTFRMQAISGTLVDGSAVAKGSMPMPDGASDGVLTREATNGNAFSFGEMTFAKPGTYLYNIDEMQPENPLPGVSYSTDLYRATVTVTDDGKGTLSSSVNLERVEKGADVETRKASSKTVSKKTTSSAKRIAVTTMRTVKIKATDNNEPVAQITNVYDALLHNWSPKVRKQYVDNSGGNPLTAGKFTFKLVPIDGAPLHVIGDDGSIADVDELTTKNTANGEASFKDIRFTDKDLGANGSAKTYAYRVSEIAGDEHGMSYDKAVYTFEVTVGRDTGGLLAVTQVVKDADGNVVTDVDGTNAAMPTFSNTYTPQPVKVQLKARKTLKGGTLKAGQFSFKLYHGFQFGDPKGQSFTAEAFQTKTNDADGDVSFDELTFYQVGTTYYSLIEDVPDGAVNNVKDGVTYKDTWNYVKVTVTLDKQTGKLKATVTDMDTGSDTTQFTNTYDAAGSVTFYTRKIFENIDGTAHEIPEDAFDFTLYEGNVNAAGGSAKPLQTKTVPASTTGNSFVTFDTIVFGMDDLRNADGTYAKSKTFTYSVKENIPAENDPKHLAGVTYDEQSHTYQVTVTDNGAGKLTTRVEVDGEYGGDSKIIPVITNRYSAVLLPNTGSDVTMFDWRLSGGLLVALAAGALALVHASRKRGGLSM